MMRQFKLLLFIVTLILAFNGCSSSEKTSVNSQSKNNNTCPECNMQISDSKLYTAAMKDSYFDDIGCLVIYSQKNNIDLKTSGSKVFTNDTKTYIDSNIAYYKTNEITPMNYGFGAYQNENDGTINFNNLIIRMLRGENLTNPKIRKKTLGNKA